MGITMGTKKSFKKAMALAGFAAGFSLFAVSGANAAPDPNFHIYIAYGQSNMEGNATNFDKNVDGKEHPRVKMFATTSCSNLGRPTVGEMYPAVPPMFKCNAGLSPADWFGRHMADSLPNVTIGIIPVAQGGTSIRLFDPDDYKNYINSAESWLKSGAKAYGDDGNAMGRIIEVAKKAQEKGVIKGIIFHQGETDGGMSNWEQIVKKTYEYMLKQLGLKAEETPFVAGEMVDGGSCAGFNSRVNNLSKYIVNFGVASSKGYGSKGDGLHFTVEGYRGMGLRYAQQMLKLINVEPVDPVPQEPFSGKAIEIPGKVEVENFDKPGIGKGEDGTDNASYSDADSENKGDSDYRKDTGVDLYKTADGGVAIGYTQTGEWLEYTVNVKADGEYDIEANVASGNSTSAFKLYLDDKAITDDVSVPQTADNVWDTYKTIPVKEKVKFTAGKHVLKLEITANYANIDWISIAEPKKDTLPDGIAKVRFDMTEAESNYSVYSMQGKKLGTFTAKGMAQAMDLVKTDAKLRKQSQGVFFVRKDGEKLHTKKVVVYE